MTLATQFRAALSRIAVLERQLEDLPRLRRDSERLRLIETHIREVFWMATPDISEMVYISPGYEQVWGRSRQSLIDEPFSFVEAIHPEDRERVLTTVEGQQSGLTFEHSYRIVRPNGEIRWIWDRGEPSRDSDGKIAYYVGVAVDITALKTAESRLQVAEGESRQREEQIARRFEARIVEVERDRDRLAMALQSAGVAIWEWDLRSGRFHSDSTMREFHGGLPADEATLDDLLRTVHEDDRNRVAETLTKALGTTDPSTIAYRTIDSSGHVRHVEMCVQPSGERGRAPRRWVGTARDVSAETTAASNLRTQQANSAQLFSRSPVALLVARAADRQIVQVNDAFARLVGQETARIVGSSLGDSGLFPLHFPGLLDVSGDAGITVELELRCVNGPRDVEVRAYRMVDTDVDCWLMALRDMSERRRIEEMLRRGQRTLRQANFELKRASELKDHLLWAVSHELRTPLTSVIGLSEAMKEGLYGPLQGAQVQAMDDITGAGHYLLELVNGILDLARVQAGAETLTFGDTDVLAVCESVLDLVHARAARKGVRLEGPAPSSHRRPVSIDAQAIRRVVLNLLDNAIKFTPTGGAVTLRVEHDESAKVLKFVVQDNGVGVRLEQTGNLFRPFSQLDAGVARRYGGTGLGLALARGLVQLHGGAIGVRAADGGGAVFFFEIPSVQAPSDDTGSSRTRRAGGGRRRIDSDVVWVSARADETERALRACTDLDWRVSVVRPEEVDTLPKPAEVRLVLLDGVMGPARIGVVIGQLREHRCVAPAVVISDLDVPAIDQEFVTAGAARVLHFPLVAARLSSALASDAG